MTMSPLAARDLAVLWHPCAQMQDYRDFPPLEVVGASGCHLELADGSRLIDGISSWWCKSLGHRHPRLTAALRAQSECFEHVILANTTNEPVVAFCEELLAAVNGGFAAGTGSGERGALGAAAPKTPATAAILPAPLAKVFLSGDGSTGIEVALKLAVQFQRQTGQAQRTRFACLENGYHGESIATMSVSDCGLYKAPYADLCFPTTVLSGLPYRCGPTDTRWQDAAAEWPAIAAQLDVVADQLAGIIVEPVLQGAGGMRLYSPDLLRRLRSWCDAHGVVLIADEIATGMGRLGAILGCHLTGILPDIAVLSKGLTGGYLPLSATVLTQRIYAAFLGDWASGRAFLHSNTYSGNALGVAVARAALAVYHDETVLAQVAQHGPTLALPELPWLRNHRQCGMMAAADVVQRDGTPFPAAARTGYRIYRAAVRRGALLRTLGDTVYLLPPLIAKAAVIAELRRILTEAISEVCTTDV
jgi:adenosylmethionine-8-amino-7-oxononanoate aminotransferase